MNQSERLLVPQNFEGWSLLLQSIGNPDRVEEKSQLRTNPECYIRRVSFPPNLIGMSAGEGSVLRVGNADNGYKLRVRGGYPSGEEATFAFQRPLAPIPPRNEDFWIGVTVEQPRLARHWLPLHHETDAVPQVSQLENPTSRYMRLELEEYPALAGLLYGIAGRRRGDLVSQLQPLLALGDHDLG